MDDDDNLARNRGANRAWMLTDKQAPTRAPQLKVPSATTKTAFLICTSIIFSLLLIKTIACAPERELELEPQQDDYTQVPDNEHQLRRRRPQPHQSRHSHRFALATSQGGLPLEPDGRFGDSEPPLEDSSSPTRSLGGDYARRPRAAGQRARWPAGLDSIQPARVLSVERNVYTPDTALFSPIFSLQTADPFSPPTGYRNAAGQPDPAAALDLVEQGSGAGGNWDEPNSVADETFGAHSYDATPAAVSPSSVLQAGPEASLAPGEARNNPPVLNRRLPKLSATTGQVWRYFVPPDTFLDEDGDLRQLKSSILRRPQVGANGSQLAQADQYYSWIQYDPSAQLLYGFPTDNEAGRHELRLLASDRLGDTSEETVEIMVRQHQSTRAFTHLFALNKVSWDQQRFPSLVDALGELVRRLSGQVYLDQPFASLVVQHLSLEPSQTPAGQASFSVAWSNASLAIHPCNTSALESLLRPLVDQQLFASPDWSLERSAKLELTPSQSLMRELSPEFRPASVGFQLQGACERTDGQPGSGQPVAAELALAVRVKIGKLSWKLGEPIEYRIPADTFQVGAGAAGATRELELSVHTIEGLLLEKDVKYSFMDFDQDTQTLYGLPYRYEDHVGQRELQLTGRHPASGMKVREVFIVDIEPQDLSTLNNRAFKVSLYFLTRGVALGARERVGLSHKMVAAIHYQDSEFHYNKEYPDFVVVDIQKFYLGAGRSNSSELLATLGALDAYRDKIVRLEDEQAAGASRPEQSAATAAPSYLYRYTWTNESIGHRGDCPIEVIKDNILYALEQTMLDLGLSEGNSIEDATKNDTEKFYDRLRRYFEPELDLVHLRFEPIGACASAFELHDVGNSDIADYLDRSDTLGLAGEEEEQQQQQQQQQAAALPAPPRTDTMANKTARPASDPANDEYWAIVVLIVLVVVLIFVIIMFFMGMHTYKINQDKRFELQVRLAQARQNSMYLSSMILANQATTGEPSAGLGQQQRQMCIVQDEEKSGRKPVILDSEKHFLLNASGHFAKDGLQATAVQLSGQTVQTLALKPNTTFTLDSMPAVWQSAGMSQSGSLVVNGFLADNQRSMTLNRKVSSSSQQRMATRQTSMSNMNHSQSILTVASFAGQPVPLVGAQMNGLPHLVYAPMPVVSEYPGQGQLVQPVSYQSLQRTYTTQKPAVLNLMGAGQTAASQHQQQIAHQNQNQNGTAAPGKTLSSMRSPSSYSSSNSATTHSVISNPNFVPNRESRA